MQPGSTDSSMLVVSDIDDVFLPKPTDLLVNLSEARPALEALLGRIGDMFQDNSIIGSALGPALQAGSKLMVCLSRTQVRLLVTFFCRHRLEGKYLFFRQACRRSARAH